MPSPPCRGWVWTLWNPASRSGRAGLLGLRLQPGLKHGLGRVAQRRAGQLAPPLEQDQHRDALDAEVARNFRILDDVQLGDADPVAELVAQLLERRRDPLARRAPFGPEIDQDGPVRSKHILLETVVGDGRGGHSHSLLMRASLGSSM